jgi:hypothetical protein
MTKLFSLILTFALIFQSCKRAKHVSSTQRLDKIIDVQENKKKDYSCSTLFSDYDIVPLQTTSESYIKRINRIYIFESRFYVLDKSLKSVFCFSNNGEFLYKINYLGKGPGEYIQIRDFTILEKEKKIVVCCDVPEKLIYYDLDGKFLSEEKLSMYFWNISSLNSNIIFYSRTDWGDDLNYKIWVKKQNELVPFKHFDVSKDLYLNVYSTPNLISSENLYYCEPFNDTVFKVSVDGAQPFIYMNFDNKVTDKSIESGLESKENIVGYLVDRDFDFYIQGFRETKNYYLFSYSKHLCLYNKNNQALCVVDNLIDDIIGSQINYFPHDGESELFLSVMMADDLCKMVNDDSFNAEKPIAYVPFIKMAKKLNSMDNPVLFVYRFK